MDSLVITKTLRVPLAADAGAEHVDSSATLARQLDAALTQVGFKASGPLLEHLSTLPAETAMDRALHILGAVREMVGDHVAHNVYFIDFPRNVPDTIDFWLSCLRDALTVSRVGGDGDVPTDAELMLQMSDPAFNLLALPNYGRYQHTYAEMLAAHDQLIPSVKDRVTVLHLGGTLDDELAVLYRSLAQSTTPLGEADLARLEMLASLCLDSEQPQTVPVRQNRAVINAVRLGAERPLVGVDTVTDVLRVACVVSDGDVTLATPTRFRPFPLAERRILMAALDAVVADNPAKLGDVNQYAERWKRLGERIYPGNAAYNRYPHARDVFAVARGDKTARSLAGQVEIAFASGQVRKAASILASAPGMLVRSLDRLLREAQTRAASTGERSVVRDVLATVESSSDQVSGRVLLSLRDHLINRGEPQARRVFTNGSRRTWVTEDTRPALNPDVIGQAAAIIDAAISRRLPECGHLVIEADMMGVAIPLSGKATEDGFGVLPRGSIQVVDNEVLRLFTYWRQTHQTTDYDLSALFLNEEFQAIGQVSYTNVTWGPARHSGDITSAPNGASEFIDIPLRGIATAGVAYIVPQINIYGGEGFNDVAESMIGFMTRGLDQKGAPFEATTVRTRSTMRGEGRVALPMVFMRDTSGTWFGKYLHLYLSGEQAFNRVEGNHRATSLLAQAMVRRRFLTVADVMAMWTSKVGSITVLGRAGIQDEVRKLEAPVTYLGISRPDGLPEGSTAITPETLNELVPQ